MTDTLTATDQLQAALGLGLDTSEKRELYLETIRTKWEKKGWLNSEHMDKLNFPKLKTRYHENQMALILENQARFQRMNQHMNPVITGPDGKLYVRSQSGGLRADTTTADEALPTVQVMPIIRRVYARVMEMNFSVVQPMAGPTSYVFFLDFLREIDSTNLLSLEYNQLLTPELGVPNKGKMRLQRSQITALKQLLALTWSLESQEDAQAILGINVETELMAAFTQEFTRNIVARHLQSILLASNATGAGTIGTGSSLPGPWSAANPLTTIPARGALTISDYKSQVYNSLIDADTEFYKRNFIPSNAIICGFGLAGFLRKLFTATGAIPEDDSGSATVGVSNYGTYESRWQILGTMFLPDNLGFVYRADPDPLYAGHVYAPYVPLMAMPRVYADFDTSTGAYQNKDAYTRNLRERSANIVTKPYAFLPITAATLVW